MSREGLITVEDLLRSPALQLRLLAGESGTGRRVAWAHVSELEDPTPWLFGSELLDGLRVPPPEYADLIPATVTSPPTVPGGYVLPVTGPRGTAGYLLAMESPAAAPAGLSVVQHIATVAALQLSMLAHEREMLRRSGAETLAEMLQGLLEGAVVTRRLVGNGFVVDRPLRLAVVPAAADDDRVADVFAAAGLPCRWPRCGWPCAARPRCPRD
ncbi:MAG: PucR family transcriptional regulator ligand-binding domain-containing protein [Streptosporangiaceae bacterium]